MYRLELLITKISVRWLEHDSTNRWLIQLFSYLSVTQQWIIICYLSKLFAKLRCKVVKFGLLYCKVKTVSSVLDSYQCMLVLYAKTSNKGDIDVKTLKWFFSSVIRAKKNHYLQHGTFQNASNTYVTLQNTIPYGCRL